MAKMTAPLISIALCTYNGAKYLQEQFDSLFAQTLSDFEVVVVDDASTDDTWTLLQDIAAKHSNVSIIRNSINQGPTKNFQTAMQLCKGSYIAPCDQDDIWAPEKLQKLMAAIKDSDMAYCNSAYVNSDGVPTGRSIADDVKMLSGKRPFEFIFYNSVSGHALLMRRDLLETATPFPGKLFYDWWLALCAAQRNGIVYVDESLVKFRRHSNVHTELGTSRMQKKDAVDKRQKDIQWLQERKEFLEILSERENANTVHAKLLLEALHQAIDLDNNRALTHAFWQIRQLLPAKYGSYALGAFSMSSRFKRRIKRIKRQPD
jgi:glycosyltransferase involved in cell wall biosynthesis